jgi:SAM-dependent methyltransferase
MKLIYRLRNRVKKEGICKTFEYIGYATFYCIREGILNTWLDLRYSHRLLRGNITTSYKALGANDVYHTKYSVLPIIFRMVRISKKDIIVDVGCGKGRVINYLLSKGYRNKMIGLELDKEIAATTAKQFYKYKNVVIISGNALQNIPKDGTIFYFYNPFSREVVIQFEELLAQMFANRPIRIIYYNPKSIDVFCNGNWKIKYINFEHDLGYKRWGRINKYHELAILTHITGRDEIEK